jgi:CDP-diacylglycerol--serine O-phosphatidyltransferase
MTRVPVLPNIITALGLTCGLFVIFKINMTEIGGVDLHVLTVCSAILLLGALADLLDGAIARAMRAQSSFGSFFDSIADAITFGVAPSVVVLKSLSITPGTEFSYLMTTGAMIYSLSGVLRLVRFNVLDNAPKEDVPVDAVKSKNFTGLPIPAAAAAIVSLNLFLVSNEFKFLFDLSEHARAWVLFTALVMIGYFMISRWKFPSFKALNLKVTSFKIVFYTVILAVIFFYGILNHFPVTFFALSWAYVVVAWIFSILRVIAGRRTKALEDYEPEPDDELDS